MSKTWYPMIDYEKCIECGECVDMCNHNVYDKKRFPLPKVVFPDGCITDCNGCGDKCSALAISYFGDENKTSEGCCDCDCGDDCGCDDDTESDCGCDGGCC